YKFRGELAQSIALSPLMGPDSRLLLHRPREDPLAALPENLFLADTRQYGRSVVDIFMLKKYNKIWNNS
ncbi:MAG: hypothetical protein LBU21_05275, partial [Treponema sp.]|nr:hypothetical protein [Treponema sp.]